MMKLKMVTIKNHLLLSFISLTLISCQDKGQVTVLKLAHVLAPRYGTLLLKRSNDGCRRLQLNRQNTKKSFGQNQKDIHLSRQKQRALKLFILINSHLLKEFSHCMMSTGRIINLGN